MAETNRDLRTVPKSCPLRVGETQGASPALAANQRIRHPGYEVFRLVVRESVVAKGVLGEADALVLISHGVDAAARQVGVSGRTIRRRIQAAGASVSELVRRVRLDATERASRLPVPTTVVARWLGFTNPDAYRRFVRREMGVSVKQLRRGVRESTVFRVRGQQCDAATPLYCSKIASLNVCVKDLSTAEKGAVRQSNGGRGVRNE